MDCRYPFPGKRTFVCNESVDPDEELGRSLKRIRLEDQDCCQQHDTSKPPMIQQCQSSPGELCIQRDLQHALANQVLQPSAQAGVFHFRNGGTLTQVTSTQFLFSFESRWSGSVTVSLDVPKRYPHQPPSLSVASDATIYEQQCFSSMISISPPALSPQSSDHTILWSPVYRLADVLGWILRFTIEPLPQPRSVSPKRLSHPSIIRR